MGSKRGPRKLAPQSLANLKRGIGNGRKPSGWTAKKEEFAQAIFAGVSKAAAAIAAGYSPITAYYLAARPDVQQRLKQIEAEYGQKRTERTMDHAAEMIEHTDFQLMQIVAKGEGKPGRIRAGRTIYERFGLIEGPGARINNNPQANASAGIVNATAFQVYQGKVFDRRQAELTKRAETSLVQQPNS